MEEQNVFNFILNDKIFTIPSKFPSLNDVDPSVLEILKTKKEYEVESNVSNDNFQSFLDNWVKKEPLNLTVSNYYDYDQLSQEFDRIKEQIELFNKFYIREEARANKNLRKEVSDLQKKFKDQTIRYGQLIEYFCHKFQFISYSDFLKKKDDLYGAFQIEYVSLIDVYGGKKVTFQGMWYSIDLTDKTAILLGNANAKGDVFIPRAVIYDNEEYVIKKIMNRELWSNITSLHFAEDSEIEKIEYNSFNSNSNLKKIIVPPSVSVIESDSFSNINLESIEFSMNSKLKELCFSFFSRISIKSFIVPPSVTIIRRYAFYLCNNLKTVEIAPNSQLKEIESFAFSVSPIEKLVLPSSVEVLNDGWSTNLNCIEVFQNGNENIMNYKDIFILGKSNLQNDKFDVLLFAQKNIEEVTIPSFVKCISKYSFANCKKLKKIEFEKDSKIEIIESNAFKNSSIESISIPSSIKEFKDDWCCMTSCLKNIEIIECERKNISLYNNKYLMYKSNPNKNDFDTLLFAPRDITTAIIPEFTKKIASCAFQNCRYLKKVECILNSKLKVIG